MLRVVKVGGSLLDWPELHGRLRSYIHQLSPLDSTLILVGGGKVVDAIREYDRIHSLDPMDCHWLCVDLMHSTAHLLGMMFPGWLILDSPQALGGWLIRIRNFGSQAHEAAIVSPKAFYSRVLNSERLPVSWDTTSDSISALLASLVEADELVLLKSTLHSNDLVDSTFEKFHATNLNVRLENFREIN